MVKAKVAVAYMSAANKQHDTQSESINLQREAILAYANKNEFIVEAFFDDTVCEDETLKGILGFCKGCAGINYLIVSDATRISRNAETFFYWKNAFKQIGVEIVSVKNEPLERAEKVFHEIMEILAADDTLIRREVAKKGTAARAKKGYAVQRPPLGYTKTGIKGLYRKTNAASALTCYFKDTVNGKMTPEQLRVAVSRLYHPTKLIKNARLKNLASNPYYAGFISYGGELYEGLHEPILTTAEQKQLLRLLEK